MNYKNDVMDKLELQEMEDLDSCLVDAAMLAKFAVPYSHRKIADSYVMLKKLCGFQAAQPRISNVEKALLHKYNFDMLENTTIRKINSEIILLKSWALSTEDILRNDAEELLQIRVKELKFINSNRYTSLSNEIYKGYKAIELYLTEITNYYSICR